MHLVVDLTLSLIVLRVPQLLLYLLNIVCFLVELAFTELMQPVILVLHELEISLELFHSLTQFRCLCLTLPSRLTDRIH